jgi:signal transduction histidine kinase
LSFVSNFADLSAELAEELFEKLEALRPHIEPECLEAIFALADDLRQDLAKIKEHSARADRIIHEMLMHSRGHTGERRPVNLNSLVAESVNQAYHGMRAQDSEFHARIQSDYGKNVGEIAIIPQDFSRVILNVATNALQAMREKQRIAGHGYEPVFAVSTRATGDRVEVRIRDNGTGISRSIRNKIFDPFFTTKPAGEGTGLGLSLSHDIVVQEHNGEIFVESEEGNFTEFLIVLPKHSQEL